MLLLDLLDGKSLVDKTIDSITSGTINDNDDGV